jgi:hypothetical protein
VTHTLRHQPSTPSLRRYREEVKRPLDPEVVRLVVTWLLSRSQTHDAAPALRGSGEPAPDQGGHQQLL